MKKSTRFLSLAASVALLAGVAGCATNAASSGNSVVVGGAAMLPTRNIVENASKSADHTTLVNMIQAADLVESLQSDGPFTVLAPTNAAFDKVPAPTREALMRPENKAALQEILTCHVIAGEAMASDIAGMIVNDGGAHDVKTAGGCTLVASSANGTVMFTDENGTVATVTTADVVQSNGVIHVIDTVLLPKQ